MIVTEYMLTAAEIAAVTYDPQEGGLARVRGAGCEWVISTGTAAATFLIVEYADGPGPAAGHRYRVRRVAAADTATAWATALRLVCDMSIDDFADNY